MKIASKITLSLLLCASLSACVLSAKPPLTSESYPKEFLKSPSAKAAPEGKKIKADLPWRTDLDNALEKSNKVVIPSFIMVFQIDDSAKARVQGGRTFGGGQSSGAKAAMSVKVSGLDKEYLQSIVDSAYADLLAQLEASGREVITAEQMRDKPGYSGFDFAKTDNGLYFEKPSMTSTKGCVAISPTGLPLWWPNGTQICGHMVGKIFDQTNTKSLDWTSKSNEAVAIMPIYTVNFVDMDSSGNSMNYFGGGKAKVSAKTNLNINTTFSVFHNLLGGWATAKSDLGTDIGGIVKVDENNYDGFVTGIAGIYGSATTSSDNVLQLDKPLVKNKLITGSQGINAGFIDLVKKYKP